VTVTPTVYVYESDDGERLVIGIYVDNLQIAHSVSLDSDGHGTADSFYEKFRAELSEEFDVVDEGPMSLGPNGELRMRRPLLCGSVRSPKVWLCAGPT
jgi:hypothetical protein